jgi:hypothetical protein
VPSEWEPGWLPIARELGMGLLLADLSQPESDQLPVVTYYWDSEPEAQTASIADAVRVWIDVLTKYAIWLPDEGRWRPSLTRCQRPTDMCSDRPRVSVRHAGHR